MHVQLAELQEGTRNGGVVVVFLGDEIITNFSRGKLTFENPRFADQAAERHGETERFAGSGIAEGPWFSSGGGVFVRTDEDAVQVELVDALGTFGYDKLIPGIKRHFVNCHVWKRHGAVSVNGAEKKSMVVRAEDKVHPIVLAREHPVATFFDLRQSPEKEILFAGVVGEEPAADAHRVDAVELIGEIDFGVLQGRGEFEGFAVAAFADFGTVFKSDPRLLFEIKKEDGVSRIDFCTEGKRAAKQCNDGDKKVQAPKVDAE